MKKKLSVNSNTKIWSKMQVPDLQCLMYFFVISNSVFEYLASQSVKTISILVQSQVWLSISQYRKIKVLYNLEF